MTNQGLIRAPRYRPHALTISVTFLLALFLCGKFKLELSSLSTNVALGSLLYLQHWVNMVNFSTFTSLAYLTQVAFLGGNAQPNSSQLMDIVPKREVLYVGGEYTNITASLDSH
jgi:hypothetical protein